MELKNIKQTISTEQMKALEEKGKAHIWTYGQEPGYLAKTDDAVYVRFDGEYKCISHTFGE